MNENIVRQAAESGLPALKELFGKLSKEDALKGLGMLVIMGIVGSAIEAIKSIVMAK